MRPLAVLAGTCLAVGATGFAQAQTIAAASPAAMLQSPIRTPEAPGAFASSAQRTSFVNNGEVVTQDLVEVSRPVGPRAVDTLRLTSAVSAVPVLAPEAMREAAYAVDYRRTWPGALSSEGAGYRLDLSPEAEVGYGAAGASLGGGATLTLSREDSPSDRLARMGVEDGARYGDQGRWYLFAAAKGRAVGLSMTADGRDWTTDPAALVGDAQVGLGWRQGDMQTSLGYTLRRVKVEDRYAREAIDLPSSDQVVGLSFSYKPRPR